MPPPTPTWRWSRTAGRAIEGAVGEAQPGDVVVIAGKGHEATQVVGDRTIEFDDRAVARDALRALRGSGRW